MFRVSFAVCLAASTMFTAPAFAAEADGAKVVELAMVDTIVVTGSRDGYDRKRISSATKTDTPLQDVPQAVSVITAEQMSDQGLRSITDVLRAVPGATVASGEGHRDQIALRGQSTTADFFVDGIRDDVQYYRPLYNLERVEVLKGPNAMIFGRGGGGGIVNRVTKKADDRDFVRGAASVDSHGAWSTGADLNARLGDGIGARLNAAYETFDSFRDHVGGHRIGITPTFGWDIGDKTRVDLTYEYAHDRRTVDRGIPSDGGRPLKGVQDQFFGDPRVNRTRFDGHIGDLAIRHDFSDHLKWVGKVRLATYDKFYRNAMAATELQGDGTVGIEAYQSATKRDSFFVQNDLIATVATGPVEHTLLAGMDFGSEDSRSDRQQGFFDAAGTVRRIYVPLAESDALPPIFFIDSPVRRATDNDTDATAWGVYVQDQAKVGDHVEIVAGLRHDWFKLNYRDLLNGGELSRKDSLWSPRLGLVLKPTEDVSVYASWAKSFLPQSGDQFSSLNVDTAALEPEKFVNKEVGLKWSVLPRLDVTLAAYVLNRTNTRATDPVSGDVVLTGAQRSKGIEASVTGKINGHLSIAAAAALQKARITRDTSSAPSGREVASVPHFTASMWGRYDITKRFGLGAGLYHQSKSYASISNAVVVPGYTRLDAAAFIGLAKNVELQLNVENLLDKDYVGLSHTDNNLNPGNPRTVRAALRFSL